MPRTSTAVSIFQSKLREVSVAVAILFVANGCAVAVPQETTTPTPELDDPSASTSDPEGAGESTDGRYVQVRRASSNPFVGQVFEYRHGLVGIRFADSRREWLEPERIESLSLVAGARVIVLLRSPAHLDEREAEVIDVGRELVQVSFDDEHRSWISLALIHQILEVPRLPRDELTPEEGDFAVGTTVVALTRGNNEEIAEVLDVNHGLLRLRWILSGQQEWIATQSVARVFSPNVSELAPGLRIRFVGVGGATIGTIVEVRQGFVRIGQSPLQRGEWTEVSDVLEVIPVTTRAQLMPGSRVRARYGGRGRVYEAAVVQRNEHTVTVQWSDGSRASEVRYDDIVELL